MAKERTTATELTGEAAPELTAPAAPAPRETLTTRVWNPEKKQHETVRLDILKRGRPKRRR